jgi:PAS domain S-box-containing protein
MSFEYQAESGRWTWSTDLRELHGLGPTEQPSTDLILERMVAEDRSVMLARFEHHLQHPGPYSCVYRMRRADGQVRKVIFVGESEAVDGVVKRLTGFVVDITGTMRQTAREAVAASAEHRATIEQAKGALMLSFGVDEDGAFDLLRAYSSRNNIKLAQVAERLVMGLADPAFSVEEPVRKVLDRVMDLDRRR